MKRAAAVFLGCLLVAAAAFWAVYFVSTGSQRALLGQKNPELLWLKKEFQLSDGEFQRIEALHQAYLPHCAEMCQRIAMHQEQLDKLLGATNGMTAEIDAAITEGSRLRAECQRQMLRHFFEVSRTMPPEQGRRYLEWVKERTFLPDFGMPTGHLQP